MKWQNDRCGRSDTLHFMSKRVPPVCSAEQQLGVGCFSLPAHLRGVLLSSSLQHLTLNLFSTLYQLFFFSDYIRMSGEKLQTEKLHCLYSSQNSFCLFLARQPPVGQGLLIYEVSRSHTTT